MIAVIKQELATFFYGFTRKYAKRLRTARARVCDAEKERDSYKREAELYASEVCRLNDMLEEERRKAKLPGAVDVAACKVRDWDKAISLGEDAIAADRITKAKRRGAKTTKALNTERSMRAAATRAMNKWKEAKKEFDKKYPPCE